MLTGTCLVLWVFGAAYLDGKYKLSECRVTRKEQSLVDLRRIRNRRLDNDSLLVAPY